MDEGEARNKEIGKVYRGPEGGKSVFKTWQDAREINPRITLNEVKWWFKQNVQPKGQVWGQRNSYVAQSAYIEYQADLIFITEGQFENQEYVVGLTMIDVFSKYAVVLPVRKEGRSHNRSYF